MRQAVRCPGTGEMPKSACLCVLAPNNNEIHSVHLPDSGCLSIGISRAKVCYHCIIVSVVSRM